MLVQIDRHLRGAQPGQKRQPQKVQPPTVGWLHTEFQWNVPLPGGLGCDIYFFIF